MSHRRISEKQEEFFPAYVVWELTLSCDHACAHCGSRAGSPRNDELSLEEALGLAEQILAMKTREVVLIGGEAYLYKGFFSIVQALAKGGVRVSMTTGGRGITAELAQKAVDSGLHNVSVSIDGLADSHNRIRRAKNSFQAATKALEHFGNAGCGLSSNMNINRYNCDDLEDVYLHLQEYGVSSWQLQITTPLGRAADRPDMLLQPYDLLSLMPRIEKLKKRANSEGILLLPGNNLGYFGPEEALLRSFHPNDNDHWLGCQAGRFVMGIESNGAIKGCPSLQTDSYVGGTIREKSLQEIWQNSQELAFTRNRSVEDLWGFCKTCPFAETCLGGCSFTAHSLFGKPGNNPYCHFRAKSLAKQGKLESLILKQKAPQRPFDHGLFELREEAFANKP
ncbi:MAG: radical SAM protein [Spirochaetota bacterium]